MTRLRWIEPSPIPEPLPALHHDAIVHQLLARRGIRNAADSLEFLNDKRRHSPDPSGLPNVQAAVDRIGLALRLEEQIGIFGDYDADGVTSTALMTRALRAAARRASLVTFRLPTRDKGYGLNTEAIDTFAAAGVSLLIAIDCGSSDHEQVAHARSRGMDVISLDHHKINGEPPADAIVVSAQLGGPEQFKDLCATGVAYLVVAALARDGYRIDGDDGEPETDLLDLVALGTIADMVPVIGINRSLIRDGLRVMREERRHGVRELLRRAGIARGSVTSENLAFKIGPRLNAAGRMGDPQPALDLLLEDEPRLAVNRAFELEELNTRRRAETKRVVREAELLVESRPELLQNAALVLVKRGWPSGLLGIVAAQIVEKYGKPVIVLTTDGERCHGSARSVPGLDITEAIRSCAEHLQRYGGHEQAAGLSLPAESLESFSAAFESATLGSGIGAPVQPEIRIDADLPHERLTLPTVHAINLLQPFGMGNEQPLFRLRNVEIRSWDAIGADKSHIRLQLGARTGVVKAVAFGMAHRSREFVVNRQMDVLVVLKEDQWNGKRRLDLEVKDFRPAS